MARKKKATRHIVIARGTGKGRVYFHGPQHWVTDIESARPYQSSKAASLAAMKISATDEPIALVYRTPN